MSRNLLRTSYKGFKIESRLPTTGCQLVVGAVPGYSNVRFFSTLRVETCLDENKKDLHQKLEHLSGEGAGVGWCNFFCLVMKIACSSTLEVSLHVWIGQDL